MMFSGLISPADIYSLVIINASAMRNKFRNLKCPEKVIQLFADRFIGCLYQKGYAARTDFLNQATGVEQRVIEGFASIVKLDVGHVRRGGNSEG